MKIPLPFLVSLIIGAVTAQAVPFIEVIDVVTRVAGGTRVVENGPTTGISGQVTQSAGAFDESTGFSREVAVADVGYLVDDISAFISAQVTTAGPPTQGESEIVITFTSSKPIIVESERLINQEQSDAFLNNTSLDPFRALPAGTHTIQLTADSSANNANLALNISISEDLDVDPPPPPPPPPPPAGPLKWKEYLNGQWQQAARWTAERAPVAADKVAFDVLPAAALRSAPLDFIDVTSAGTDAGSVATLDISVSAVRFLNFNLNISGAADEPDALTIRNGGVLRVDFPLPSTNASRISFDTARTSIGDGKKQALRRGQVLDNSRLEIGSAVVWRNTGLLSVGERMQGEVLIETRLEDQTASECTGDVLLGVRPGSNGTLIVTGRFIASGLLAGSRPRTVGVVGVTRGGILETNAAELGSGERASAGAIVNDGAVLEPNGLDNYSSEGERSTWRIDGTLSLSGVPGGAAGASRGLATLDAFDGGLVTALRADVGTGAPSIKTVAGRTARISATGFDSADLEPAEIRIDGSLTVGESCSARAEAKEAGLISAGAIRVRALGRLSSVGFIPAANDFAGQNSLITTSRENEAGDVIVGALTIDGGGIVELKDGGDLTAGVLTLGGVTPKARLARLRHDSSAPEFPRGTLTMTRFILGDGISFPARFDLFDGIASIDEDSEITQGSILNGFGLIGAPSEVSIRNNGRVIVPPGAERVLEMRSSFRQGETGELILTVNKDNDASVAPLDVRGSALVLAGKVTLRFSGGRLPRPGEAYALIRAENAVIANLASFKVAGARGAFDIVEDDFGIVLVFK